MIIDYFVPESAEEILRFVREHQDFKVVAGGTESFREARDASGECYCVDISRIPSLGRIEVTPSTIRIGAGVKVSDLTRSEIIRAELPALVDAAEQFASPQIRNQATVVGNVMTGRAIAAFSVVARAIGAEIEVIDESGVKTFEVSPQVIRAIISSRQIAVALKFGRTDRKCGSAYSHLGGRAAFTFPMAAASVYFEVTGGRFANVRSVISPTLAKPISEEASPCNGCGGACRLCISRRMEELDSHLDGETADLEAVRRALDVIRWSAVHIRESALYGSADYRRLMMEELLTRSFGGALRRLKKTGGVADG